MGWLAELAGTDAELAGSTVELVGSAAELLDSSADEMASMSELLTGSWLRGMELLELVGVVSADVASDWLELAGPSVRLELFGASSARLELTIVSDELMELGAGSLPCSELAAKLLIFRFSSKDLHIVPKIYVFGTPVCKIWVTCKNQ